MLYVLLFAPGMFTPFFFHWYVNPVPVAVTLNVKLDPAHNVWFAVGCVLIAAALSTVTAATVLVTLFGTHTPLLVTTTV
jgi:hypothetical protein